MTKEELKELIKQSIKKKLISKEEVIEVAEECRGCFDLKETERAYIAGIVDGEGSISITQTEVIRRDGTKRMAYKSIISIANTYHYLLYWIKDKVNFGVVTDHHVNSRRTKKAKVIKFNLGSIEKFIKIVFPFLLIKKEQAILMLEFLSTYSRKTCRTNPLTTDEISLRKIIHEEMAILNKRGTTI